MEIPESAIREFILAGHPPKTAIAMAIAKSRKLTLKPEADIAEELNPEDEIAEPLATEPVEAERILAASGLSETAKQAILTRKSSRSFKA